MASTHEFADSRRWNWRKHHQTDCPSVNMSETATPAKLQALLEAKKLWERGRGVVRADFESCLSA